MTISFPTRCCWYGAPQPSNRSAGLCLSTPWPPTVTSESSKGKPGSRNSVRWFRTWCGSRSNPNGSGCWILRRVSRAPCRSERDCRTGSAQLVRPPAIHSHALDIFHTNELYADVVAAIFVAGKRYQGSPGFAQVVKLTGQDGDLFGGYRAVQAIAREQQNVSRQQLALVHLHVDEQVCAQGPAEQVSPLRLLGLFLREQSHAHLFANQTVIPGQNFCLAAADEITARVADMGDDDSIEAQEAGHDRGAHRTSAGRGRRSRLANFKICRLHQSFERGRRRLIGAIVREPQLQSLDGEPRSHLAAVLASDSIRQRKQPAALSRVILTRDSMSQIVFIVAANFAGIGKFSELKLKHGSPGKGLAARVSPDGARRNASMSF